MQIDYRAKTCGLAPRMMQDLDAADTDQVEFLVNVKVVPALLNSFGALSSWTLEVDQDPFQARFVFRRRINSGAAGLDII